MAREGCRSWICKSNDFKFRVNHQVCGITAPGDFGHGKLRRFLERVMGTQL